MGKYGLCGIEWAMFNRVGYKEESRLCGIVWAIWKRVTYMEYNELYGIG